MESLNNCLVYAPENSGDFRGLEPMTSEMPVPRSYQLRLKCSHVLGSSVLVYASEFFQVCIRHQVRGSFQIFISFNWYKHHHNDLTEAIHLKVSYGEALPLQNKVNR